MSDTIPLERSRTLPSASLQVTDLPASPPPTSPLPPTPVQTPTPSPNVFLTYPSVPPQRPPRPQTSLPNLRPLIVFSPELKRKADQYHASSVIPSASPQKSITTSRNQSTDSTLPSRKPLFEPQNVASIYRSPGSFTTAVFDALPLENWPLPAEPHPSLSRDPLETNYMIPSTSRSRPSRKRNKKPPTKAVARTALYIPQSAASNSSLELSFSHNSFLPHKPKQPVIVWTVQDEDITSLPQWPGVIHHHHNRAISDPGSTPTKRTYPNLFHRRYQSDILASSFSTTTRSFFLRRRPSTPIIPVISSPILSTHGSLQQMTYHLEPPTSSHHTSITNFQGSIYKPEINNAGMIATSKSNNNNFNNYNNPTNYPLLTNTNLLQPIPHLPPLPIQSNTINPTNELLQQPISPWYIRRNRYMWMLATLIVVLVVTAGVLGGILWRLRHL